MDLDVRARLSRFDLALGGSRADVLIGATGAWTLLRRGQRRLKFCNIELHVSVDISRELCSLRKGDVLAVHEQEKWRGRKEQNARPHDSRRHYPSMAAAFTSFHRTQGCLLPAHPFHIVDIDLKFASPRHSPLPLSF